MKKSVQLGANAHRTCPGFAVLCFLCAFITCLFGAKSASADTPPAAIRTTPLAVPATVLGMTNPYLVAAAIKTPEVRGFTLSQDIRDLAAQVEKLQNRVDDLAGGMVRVGFAAWSLPLDTVRSLSVERNIS